MIKDVSSDTSFLLRMYMYRHRDTIINVKEMTE